MAKPSAVYPPTRGTDPGRKRPQLRGPGRGQPWPY